MSAEQPRSEEEWEDLEIGALEQATPAVTGYLAEQQIFTVGALLGATRGLSTSLSVPDQYREAASALVEWLLSLLPEALVESYRGPQPDIPAPGVLPEPEEEGRQ